MHITASNAMQAVQGPTSKLGQLALPLLQDRGKRLTAALNIAQLYLNVSLQPNRNNQQISKLYAQRISDYILPHI